jgi:hypothetical protein
MEVRRCAVVGMRRSRRRGGAIERGKNPLRSKLGDDAVDFIVGRDMPMTTLMQTRERKLPAHELRAREVKDPKRALLKCVGK